MESFWRRALYYSLIFVLLVAFVHGTGHKGDLWYWYFWSEFSLKHGLGNVYQNMDNNYNPFFHYILWIFGQMMGSDQAIRTNIYWLKAFTLLFDFAGAIWAASLVPQRERRFELSLLLLLNVAYLYNTVVWEQVDAIYTFWSFGAVVLAASRRPVLSAVFYALALCTKTQAIIFLPALLLLWVPLWVARPWRAWQPPLAMAATFLLVLAPFIWGGWQNDLPRILAINFTAVDLAPRVSLNAFNMWVLLIPKTDLLAIPDSEIYAAGLTYKQWGLLLFMAFSALALLPLLAMSIRNVLPRWRGPLASEDQLPLVLLACGLIPICFAFFNTQMHERYWHAGILFLAAYGFVSRHYLPFILVSIGYFINLEGVLQYLHLGDYAAQPFINKGIFKAVHAAALFALTLVSGLWYLYRMPWLRVNAQFKSTALPLAKAAA